MKRAVFGLLALVAVGFMVATVPTLLPVAHGARAIGNPSGTYSFEFNSVNPISVNNLQSVGAAVGMITFDGAGNLTGSLTEVDVQACCKSGATTTSTIQTGSFTGTYQVNRDGTATMDLEVTTTLNPGNVSGTNEIKLLAAFSGNFDRAKFIETFQSNATNDAAPLPDSVVSGLAEKVSHFPSQGM